MRTTASISALAAIALAVGCESAKPEPEPPPASSGPSAAERARLAAVKKALETPKKTPAEPSPAGAQKKVEAKPVAKVTPSPDDPLQGEFSLADATAGLPKEGLLVAEIATSKGKLACELWDERAPITVANFVGLARGKRPWKDPKGEWVKKPAYDGTTFHRIVPGFMIQGGDAAGTGAGQPGYVIPDEVWEGARHDQPGLLCMANRGPNTNGAQFFVMDGKADHLDGGYTIFGKCEPVSLVKEIATGKAQGDKAVDPVKITKITIKRDAKRKPSYPTTETAPAASGASPTPSAAPAPAAAPHGIPGHP